MAEYIEREAFIDRYRKLLCEDCDRRKGMKNGKMRFCYEIGEAPCRACSVDDMLSYVDDFPASDVQPVRHGRWREGVYAGYRCSECRTTWDAPTKFCPNCGAKMDTEEREVTYDPDKFFGRMRGLKTYLTMCQKSATGIFARWIARTDIARGQMKLWNTLWKWRARQTIDFENQKLAGFLEEAVDGLFRLDPNAVAVVAINDERGIAGTQYYDCSLEDKGRMLYHILEDIIMDVTTANALMIRDAISDMEEENDEIDGEDDEIDE